MKSIIVNADDFGYSPGVNAAVTALAETGRIQATSFMAGGAAADSDFRLLQAAGTDVGLHFDLTEFYGPGNLKKVLLRSLLHRWDRQALRRLADEQLAAFEDKTGIRPVFIDGHQHVHQFAPIRGILLAAVEDRYGFCPPVRSTRPLPEGTPKSRLIYTLGGRATRRTLENRNIPCNSRFAGVRCFHEPDDVLADKWQQWLSAAPQDEVTVVMCHPSTGVEKNGDPIAAARQQEWQWLSGGGFSRLWKDCGCRAAQWRELLADRCSGA